MFSQCVFLQRVGSWLIKVLVCDIKRGIFMALSLTGGMDVCFLYIKKSVISPALSTLLLFSSVFSFISYLFSFISYLLSFSSSPNVYSSLVLLWSFSPHYNISKCLVFPSCLPSHYLYLYVQLCRLL